MMHRASGFIFVLSYADTAEDQRDIISVISEIAEIKFIATDEIYGD
jgi:hypothetical protein